MVETCSGGILSAMTLPYMTLFFYMKMGLGYEYTRFFCIAEKIRRMMNSVFNPIWCLQSVLQVESKNQTEKHIFACKMRKIVLLSSRLAPRSPTKDCPWPTEMTAIIWDFLNLPKYWDSDPVLIIPKWRWRRTK